MFAELPSLLQPDDLLVLNNARVSALRLQGRKTTGAQVEVLLLERPGSKHLYRALVKPGRRLHESDVIDFPGGLRARIVQEYEDGTRSIEFIQPYDPGPLLAEIGRTPLPPYIRSQYLEDSERYQTVYACAEGSAAAPTAGLHFTSDVLDDLHARRISTASVTLDISLDTFRPIKSEDLSDHQMHGERCCVLGTTASAVEHCPGRVVAVGTTSARTLETMAVGQRKIRDGETTSTLFIRPGYQFQIVEGILTNFHMPKTSMLMMLAALCGKERLFSAYQAALKEKYRFLSFGDSMLII